MTLEIALLFFLICYLVQIAILTVTARRLRIDARADPPPSVSVVIAARDEEHNLGSCLESVLHQTCDRHQFEVIVVNDHSSDGTERICQEYAVKYSNFRYINSVERPVLRGKPNALDLGIATARNDVILITDADCTVPTTWIEETARFYSPDVGLVGGLTIQSASTAFEGMQSLDWVYLLGLAAATISLRIPLSTIGNNLSFRRTAYLELGGYQKIPFSVTEDFVLFQAIVGLRKWTYLCPIDPKVLVTSKPCPTWKALLRQKHRWGTGGRGMNIRGLMVMSVGFGLHAAILLGAFLSTPWIIVAAIGTKVLGDYLFLRTVLTRLRRRDLLRFFLPFAGFFFSYVLLLPFIVFLGGPVRWKGRSY